MKKEVKKLTWAELKEFVNNLPEEALTEHVRWWGEDRGGIINNVGCLEEDYFNPSGDGMEPVSEYESEPETIEDNQDTILDKGTPILFTDY